MKILLVGLKLSVGMELILRSLSREMAPEYSIATLNEHGFAEPGVRSHGLTRSASYGQMVKDTLNPALLLRAFRILWQERADVLYLVSSHSFNPGLILLQRLVSLLQRRHVRVVSHIHDPVPHSKARFSWAIRLSQQLQMQLSDDTAVFGEALKDQVRRLIGRPDASVIVYPHPVCREERVTMPLPEAYPYVSLLGRLETYKGIDTFLEVARAYTAIDPDLTFVLGGAGDLSPYQDSIRLLPNLKVINRHLSTEEMDDLMQRSLATILPYRDGTQSGVTPMAYYNACPVIVSRTGSLPELVDEAATGFVVEPGEVSQIVHHLKCLAADRPHRRKMGEQCFAYYRDRLRWATATQLLFGYQRP